MHDTPIRLDTVDFRRVFPWLHLFRAFWIAVDPRKLVLAGAALMLVAAGSWVWDQVVLANSVNEERFAEEVLRYEQTRWPWQQSLGYEMQYGGDPLAELRGGLSDPWNTLVRIGRNWHVSLRPVVDVADPVVGLMQRKTSGPALGRNTFHLLWGLLVWAVFGGAIGRIAAVQFARDQQVGLRHGLAFSARNFFNYIYAPLLPLLGMAVIWIICTLGGVLGRIPGFGPIFIGVTWGVSLAIGFLMTLIVIGVTAGWPLMFATINVESTDGFDALSRGFNYVTERPLHYFGYAVFCMAFGSFAIFFVWLVSHLIVYLTALAVASGLGFDKTVTLIEGSPGLSVPAVFRPLDAAGTPAGGAVPPVGPAAASEPDASGLGTILVRWWNRLVAVLVLGFVYSFFWTSTTIIYLLLRRSVDGKELDEVQYLDEPQGEWLAKFVEQHQPVPPVAVAPAAEAAPRVDLAP